MNVTDRLTYALIGFVLGAFIGVACWWLYGLAFSLNYSGPGIDPVLRHWVVYVGGAFATLGFILRDCVGDALGNTIQAIFHFESGDAPSSGTNPWVALVFLAIVLVAFWFITR
jgi:hypothetical protein